MVGVLHKHVLHLVISTAAEALDVNDWEYGVLDSMPRHTEFQGHLQGEH